MVQYGSFTFWLVCCLFYANQAKADALLLTAVTTLGLDLDVVEQRVAGICLTLVCLQVACRTYVWTSWHFIATAIVNATWIQIFRKTRN